MGTTPQDLLNSVLSAAKRFNASNETVENLKMRLSNFLTNLYGTLNKAPADVGAIAEMLKGRGLVAVEVQGTPQLNIMANWVYAALRQMRQGRKLDPRGVIVVLDEAHQVVPRGEDTPAKGPSSGRYATVATTAYTSSLRSSPHRWSPKSSRWSRRSTFSACLIRNSASSAKRSPA